MGTYPGHSGTCITIIWWKIFEGSAIREISTIVQCIIGMITGANSENFEDCHPQKLDHTKFLTIR